MFTYLALLRYHEYLFIYSFYWPARGNLVWKWNTQSQITLKLSAWLDITQGGRGNIENCCFFLCDLAKWIFDFSLILCRSALWFRRSSLSDSCFIVQCCPLVYEQRKDKRMMEMQQLLLSFYSLIQFDRIQTGIHDSNDQITWNENIT